MAYTSKLYPGELIITDSTPRDILRPPEGYKKGLDLSDRSEGYAYGRTAEPFPESLLIPKSEWPDRIKEQEERKIRSSDLAIHANLPCKDQNGTNYCWINAPTYCVEMVRLLQNQDMVLLSPASAGGPIKGFKNVGGWGKEGLVFIQKYGLVPVNLWPANAISRTYYTEENKTLALRYRVMEWWELEPRNLDHLFTCLLLGWPVALGYNWWSHEVTGCDAAWIDGAPALRIRNSWGMSWGSQGFGILQGSKMLPDDAVVPRVAIAA